MNVACQSLLVGTGKEQEPDQSSPECDTRCRYFREKHPSSHKETIMASSDTKTRVSGSHKDQRAAFVNMQSARDKELRVFKSAFFNRTLNSPPFRDIFQTLLKHQQSKIRAPTFNCLAIMLTLLEMTLIGVLIVPAFLAAGCGILLAMWSLIIIGARFGLVARRTRIL